MKETCCELTHNLGSHHTWNKEDRWGGNVHTFSKSRCISEEAKIEKNKIRLTYGSQKQPKKFDLMCHSVLLWNQICQSANNVC